MKKFLAVLLTLLLAMSSFLTVFAEEVKIESEWAKYLGKVEVTKTEEDGETIYAFKNFTAEFATPGIDIMPLLKELIKGRDSITLNFSMELKADAEEDFTLGTLIRMEDVHPKVQKKEEFKQVYTGKRVNIIGDKNYLIRIASDLNVSEDWELVEGEITLTPDEILSGMWKRMVLCFDGIKKYELVETFYVKNPIIELVDYEEGKGEPSFDIEKIDLEKPTIELDDTDTPALPEGNHLVDNAWYKGNLGSVTPAEVGEDNIYKFTDLKSSYSSPVINIYPTLKEMLGDQESMNIWIVLDVRAVLTENDRGFGMKIRPNISNEYVEDKVMFASEYGGSTIKHTAYGILLTTYSDGKLTNKWQRIEIPITITKADINDKLWTEWNLCFDMMNDYYQIKELQIKDTAIYYNGEYESVYKLDNNVDVEGNESATKPEINKEMPVIYKPYGFDKYSISFADAVAPELPDGITDERADGAPVNDDSYLIYIIIGAGVVVLAAVAIILLKKKKTQKEEK